MKITAAKGTKDTLPSEIHKWHYVEGLARELTAGAGFLEVRTPVFEHTELFLRGVGGGTDVVQKEMYTFDDRAGRSLTLRPEGTAGVVRALVENGLAAGPQPVKLFYFSPVFRYERPQSGRLREHHQFGVELFGAADPTADAEVIALAAQLLARVGLKDLELRINSIGCEHCRPRYIQALRAYLHAHGPDLCETCRERTERNTLRVLDCKVPSCRPVIDGAPVITDYLDDECREHMHALEVYLDALCIPYAVDPRIVRGLDYYTRTVFEFVSNSIGAQGTVCGGGRYDHLVSELGGPDLPAVGFGMGLERLLLTAESEGIRFPEPRRPDAFVAVHGGIRERVRAVQLVQTLRGAGLTADIDLTGRSLKAQFKYAGKLRVRYVIVIGEREAENGTVVVKNMETGEEAVTDAHRLLERIG